MPKLSSTKTESKLLLRAGLFLTSQLKWGENSSLIFFQGKRNIQTHFKSVRLIHFRESLKMQDSYQRANNRTYQNLWVKARKKICKYSDIRTILEASIPL